MRSFKTLKVGERLKGIVHRTVARLGAIFIEADLEDNVSAFARKGQLAKRVQDYSTGEQVLVEVVSVARDRVTVKDLGYKS